jgi:DNA repair exonuclease SbcCD nuclease subunit
MHTELSGMTYDNGREITEGTVVKLPEGSKIFSGHIHKRQVSKSGDIMYLGSPYHLERSDIGNQKGIHVLNVDGENVNLEFIPNTYSPEYIKMTLTIGDDGKWQLDKDVNKLTNNYVDIELTDEVSNAINSNKVAETLLKYSPKSLTFIPITKAIQIDTENLEQVENVGVKGIFENTVTSMKLSEKDMKYLMQLNDKYIKEASEELGIQY